MRVLYVDDDAEDFLLVQRMLVRQGMTVMAAADYDAALRARDYDVCLVDYLLGERNGIELMTEMLRQRADCVAILLTTQDDHALDVEAMEAGASAFLVKGRFDGALLERTIRYAVAQRKASAAKAYQALSDEASLRSDAQFRAVFEASTDSLVIADGGGRILAVNAATCTLFIRSRESLLGSGIAELMDISRAGSNAVTGDMGPDMDSSSHRLHRPDGRPPAQWGQATITRSDRTTREVEWTLTPQFLVGRDLYCLRDVTVELRKHQVEWARTALRFELSGTSRPETDEESEAMLRLAGGVAHGFNNMLTVIRGHAEVLLSRTDLDDVMRLNLGEMDEAAERSEALTRQLLAFSRQQVVETRILDVNVVIRDLQQQLKRVLRHDIELHVDCGPVRPIRFDCVQLELIIMSMASNARDAMPRGGRLSLQTRSVRKRSLPLSTVGSGIGGAYEAVSADASTHILLSVCDDGTGMDGKTVAHIFEPFFTTKRVGDGIGLGLAAVHGIVQAADGEIQVDSRPGEGTTFRIYLKCIQSPAVGAQPALMVPPTACGTVVLVDDEPQVRRITAFMMRQFGYEVIEANSGSHALEVCAAMPGSIDILVTDMIMPGLGGREVAAALLDLRPALKVLYLSGFSRDDLLRRGVAAAEMAFLQKPFQAPALREKLRNIMEDTVRSGIANE